ncbi:MAG: DDE-type integrase/transposase/recombinase, partial [Lactococcus lactis]
RLLRWALKLQEFNFTPIYIKGEDNAADGLSRLIVDRKDIQRIALGISDDQKKEILEHYHLASGHGSQNTMEFMIKQRYNWDSIHKEIKEYVEKCEQCLKAGSERVNTKNKPIKTEFPNELWVCDLIGRIQDTNGTNKFIFMAIDHYSKWIETKVLKNKTAEAVAEAIENLIIKKNGIPTKILTDNGLEFRNNIQKKLAERYGIEWIFNSPGHHETVGAVERVNKTFMDKLRKLTNFGKTKWETQVEAATLAVNYSYNRSIRTSPYMMKFGKLPMLEIDRELNQEEKIISKSCQKNKRDEEITKYYEKDIVKGKIQVKMEANKGDKVLIYKEKLGDKLGSCWEKGFIVEERVNDDSYIVTDGKNSRKINKKHLKLDTSRRRGEGVVVNNNIPTNFS